MNISRLKPLFQARSVALVGASNNRRKWGGIMLENLLNGGFTGRVYPVNPEAGEMLGQKVYTSMSAIPEVPDLAVIVVPPPAVVPVIRECVEKGIKTGVVITAGFAEIGAEGERLQRQMVEVARQGGMALVGPNCNGIMSPWEKLFVEFPNFHVPPGFLAVIAQSGNVVDVVARQLMIKGLGCSLCVASGNEADLHIEDYLEYLADDPHTKVILCYVEGFRDGRRFFRIAREVTKKKPVIVLKGGNTPAGAQAAASHTAAIAGADEIFDAICKQSGIVRARNLQEMINIGISFLHQPLPRGRRLGIVTAGGGWGVLAADACMELGLDVVTLPEATLKELDAILPAWWNRGNPVDLVAGSFADSVFHAVEAVLSCPAVDAVIFLSIMPALKIKNFASTAEQTQTERDDQELVEATGDALDRFNALARKYGKPLVVGSEHLLATAMQETHITYALGQRDAVCYQMPHEAAEVMSALADYGEWRMKNGSI